MTGPKPFLTNGQIHITYLTGEPLVHTCRLDCNVATSGSSWFVLDTLGANYPWLTALNEFVSLLAPVLPSVAVIQTGTLLQWVGGILQPKAQASLGVAGSGGGTFTDAIQVTGTYRSAMYNLDKLVLLGTIGTVPSKQSISALSGAFGALFKDLYNYAPTHVGNWYRSKDNTQIVSGLNWVASLNKKSRRRLGLV